MELTAATILVALSGVFLICFMKGAFGGGRPSGAIVRRDGPVCTPLLEALDVV